MLPVNARIDPVEQIQPRDSAKFLVAAYGILSLWAAYLFITTACLFVSTEGSFDYVEGVALGHQLMSDDGVSLYLVPEHEPPYSIPLYGPVFYAIYSQLQDIAAPSFTPARCLNLLLTLYLSGLAFFIARQHLGVSNTAACLAVLCWLNLEPAASFLLQNRPDTLALVFAVTGFVAAISGARKSLPVAVLALTFAAYTKQTAVVAPLLAAVMVLFGTNRRRDAGILLVATVILCATVFLLLNGLTQGRYWDAAVIANMNGFSPGSALLTLIKAGQQPLFWLALVAMLFSMRAGGTRRSFAIYGMLSLMLHAIAVAKPGANSNYFLEYSWCTMLALAPLLDELLQQPYHRNRVLLSSLVLMTCTVSMGQATQSVQRLRQAADDWPRYHDWLKNWETAVKGPVASMQPGSQILEGRVPYILDPHIIARLTEQGRFDEQGFIDDLREARIAAVIGARDLTAGPGEFSNWSIGVRDALSTYYVKTDTMGHLSVWLPRKTQEGR